VVSAVSSAIVETLPVMQLGPRLWLGATVSEVAEPGDEAKVAVGSAPVRAWSKPVCSAGVGASNTAMRLTSRAGG
jgi:hypothetical protein